MTPWNHRCTVAIRDRRGILRRRTAFAHVIRSEAVFGSPTVTNQHRTVDGPSTARGNDPPTASDHYPKFGVVTFTLPAST